MTASEEEWKRGLKVITEYDHLNPEAIVLLSKLPSVVVGALLAGVVKKDLETLLRFNLGDTTLVTQDQIETIRMNAIGTLRGLGYEVAGGRAGRGQPYRIVGWKELPPPAKSWREWPYIRRIAVANIHALPTIDQEKSQILKCFALRTEPLHENSWLYLRCYEAARDRAYYHHSTRSVILQKFETQPRFRIFALDSFSSPGDLLRLAETLAEVSVRPVTIINVGVDQAQYMKALHPQGSIQKREQVLYSTDEIAELGPELMSSSSRKTFIQRTKRHAVSLPVLFSNDELLPTDRTDILHIIAEWRRVNEPKQRQLAIGRDFLCITETTPGKFVLIGYNLTHDYPMPAFPISTHISDRMVGRPDVVLDMVEKSLNYSSQLGGRSGTTDWNLWMTCCVLRQQDVKWFNHGSPQGGTSGLVAHKMKWLGKEGQRLNSLTFVTRFPHYIPTNE